MKKIYRFFLGIMVIVPGFGFSQQTWVRHAQFEKRFIQGGLIFSFIRHVDNVSNGKGFYGYFDKVLCYDATGQNVVQTLSDSNSVRLLSNGTYESAGRINFSHSHSAVQFHGKLNGNDYICISQVDSLNLGVLASNIRKLNPITYRFEAIPYIRFGSRVTGFVHLVDSKVFAWGDFAKGKDISGEKLLNGAAIWDTVANTLSPMPTALGTYYSHSISSIDGTAMIIIGSGISFHVVHRGSTAWQDSQYPSVPIGGQLIACEVVDKNKIYVSWQSNTPPYDCHLMKLNGSSWQTLAVFSSPGATDRSDNFIGGLDWENEVLYISGEHVLRDGQTSPSPVLSYNETTGQFTNLPDPGLSGFGKSRIEAIDGRLFLIDNSELIFGRQKVFELRDQTAPAPTVSLAANPGSIAVGGSSILTVIATNIAGASACTASWGTITMTNTSGNNWTSTSTVSPTATTTYMVTAQNSTGQTATASVTVTVTAAPIPVPTPVITGPNGTQTSNPVTISGTVNEGNLPIDIYSQVTSGKLGTTQANAGGVWSISLDFPEGVQQVYAIARRNGAVSIKSQIKAFKVDLFGPVQGEMTYPTAGGTILANSTMRGKNPEPGKARIKIDNNSDIEIQVDPITFEWSYQVNLNEGNHIVSYWSVDSVGHVGVVLNRSFLVSNITGLPNVNDPNKLTKLFPVPSNSNVTVKNALSLSRIIAKNGSWFKWPYSSSLNGDITFNISFLTAGSYFVEVLNKNKKPETHRMIILR